MSILGQKACILGPTIFKIPQPNWHYYLRQLHCFCLYNAYNVPMNINSVHAIPSLLVLADIQCMVHFVLPKQPINKFDRFAKKQQVLRAYCPNIYILCTNSQIVMRGYIFKPFVWQWPFFVCGLYGRATFLVWFSRHFSLPASELEGGPPVPRTYLNFDWNLRKSPD